MRKGITLYEVVLALSIFGGAIAALTQALAVGTRAALQARLQSQAVLLCQTKLAEVLSGVAPAQSVSGASFEEAGLEDWTYGLAIGPGPRVGLLSLEVAVARRDTGAGETTFSIKRLLRDPSVTSQAETSSTAPSAALTTSGSASSTSSTSSTGSGQ